MIRKLLLTAITAGALAGMTAIAGEPTLIRHDDRGHGHDHDRHDRGDYRVSYRHRGHWHSYKTFDDRDDAQRAARRLERFGYDVRIERVRPR